MVISGYMLCFHVLIMVAVFALTVYGHLLTVGDNSYGQLGQGDYKHHEGPCRVQSTLSGDKVLTAACGDGYTIVSTASEWSHCFYLCVSSQVTTLIVHRTFHS